MKSEQVYQKLQWEYGLCEIKAAIETQITSKSQQKQVSYEIKIVINHGVSKKSHKKISVSRVYWLSSFSFFFLCFDFFAFPPTLSSCSSQTKGGIYIGRNEANGGPKRVKDDKRGEAPQLLYDDLDTGDPEMVSPL